MKREENLWETWPRVLATCGAAAFAFVLGVLSAAWSTGNGARAAQGADAAQFRAPRFESLTSDRVPLRNGPGREFAISWVLTRTGLPVEVLREVAGWRQVRDADGTTGWVPQSLLSTRRTALVLGHNHRPGQSDLQSVDVKQAASDTAAVRARVETGRVVVVTACDGIWCQVTSDDVKGHVAQRDLWGVYPGERLR